jgi:ornithine carbamoyltransferase
MKHFINISDCTRDELTGLLNLADRFKSMQKNNVPHAFLANRQIGIILNKASTRTRVSFEVGINQLGARPVVMLSGDMQMGRGESMYDTAKVLGRYLDMIIIRTYAHRDAEELAGHSGVPVINALTDLSHPCQTLADLMTIREYKGALEGLSIAWVGDGNNVCHSLMDAAAVLGLRLTVATPEGFAPSQPIPPYAKDLITLTHDPIHALSGADVVFTDVWASMGQEKEAAERAAAFKGFQLNAESMAHAKKDAMVQHCLPAHKDEEITAEVFALHEKEIFDEAENRLHAQKAIMVALTEIAF